MTNTCLTVGYQKYQIKFWNCIFLNLITCSELCLFADWFFCPWIILSTRNIILNKFLDLTIINQVLFSTRSHFINKLTKWLADKMTNWQNDQWTKWPIDKMSNWQNDQLTKWPIDKMTNWQKDKLTKWPLDKMTIWKNDQLTKWPIVKMTNWQNDQLTTWQHDKWPKWPIQKMTS